METIYLPKGCLEVVKEPNVFKVCRTLVKNEPKTNEMVKFFMEGSGFMYKGFIFRKTTEYCYLKLYI